MYSKQEQLELDILDSGMAKRIEQVKSGYKRAEDGLEIRTVADKLFRDAFFINRDIVVDYITKQMSAKNRRHIFFSGCYVKLCDKYEEIYKLSSKSERLSAHPQDVLTYIATEEMCYSVVDSLMLSDVANKIRAKLYGSYGIRINREGEDNEETFKYVMAMLLVLIEDERSPFCIERRRYDNGMMISVKNKDTLVSLEELVSDAKPIINYLPLIEKPHDHTSLHDKNGGYYIIDSPLLKKRPSKWIMQNTPEQIVAAANKLQATQWTVDNEFYNFLLSTNTNAANYIKGINQEAIISMNSQIKDLTRKIVKTDKHQIVKLAEKVDELKTKVGKYQSILKTLNEMHNYVGIPYYQAVFLDARGRFYFYNNSLSPQGNNFTKSIVSSYNKQKLTQDGYNELTRYLMGMVDGYSKVKLEGRMEHYRAVIQPMIKAGQWEELEQLADCDEVYTFLAAAYHLNRFYSDNNYETGILAYIDSCSSAIQTSALLQKDKQSAYLTSMIDNGEAKLADAYLEVANTVKAQVETLAEQTDSELLVILMETMKQSHPERFATFDYRTLV